jgi:TniQ
MRRLFERWSISRPQLSPRTAAYAMKPLGIGTSMTESLTSYIVRLAEAHSVTVGDFIGRLLSRIPNSNGTLLTRAALEFRVGGHGFHACGYRINGNSDWSGKWVDALESATGRSDLRHLTLASLGSALRQQVAGPAKPGSWFRSAPFSAPQGWALRRKSRNSERPLSSGTSFWVAGLLIEVRESLHIRTSLTYFCQTTLHG